MHRQPLLQLLAEYATRYPEEQTCVTRFRRFVEQHPDCFQRSLQSGHVTGSAWLVDATGRRVLLTHHRKLAIWVQLGGHADGNPDIRAVALAEAREESGLDELRLVADTAFDLDIHRIPARAAEPAHEHYDVRFALQASGSQRYRVSAESHALAWVTIDRLGEFTREASMLRMARKWLAARKGGQTARSGDRVSPW